jgi:hypothetical protein
MKGVIYKIVITENDIYVGSTIYALNIRQNYHNYNYIIKQLNCKLYEKARENNIESLECILLEEIEFDDIEELRKKEEEYRLKLNANLNERSCFQSEEEWVNYMKNYYKDYYEKNKDKIKKKTKEYREENKDKIKKKTKEYREENKDKIKDYITKYREENKDKINEKFNCECGGKYTYQNKSTHLKSKKHQTYLSTISED